MVQAIIRQNWTKSSYSHASNYFAIDMINLTAISFNLGIR